MCTDILNCGYFYQLMIDNSTKNEILETMNYKNKCNYTLKNLKTSEVKHKNDNKTMVPYVEKVIRYLLNGENNNQQDIMLEDNKSHFDLKLK
jgi:hypothetical protein